MSDPSHRWKLISIRAASLFLGVVGLSMAYFWYYQLGPMRRVYDPEWSRQHSQVAWWEEYQQCVERSGWDHDGFYNVGRCGDKRWVQWIMEHIQPGDDIVSCRAGHKSHGLRYLTNQDVGDTAEAWLAWWKENQSKSQEEWIREGFRKVGIELKEPLTQANIIALLKLTADPGKKDNAPRDYVEYNAFRWLRDSDFDPAKFAVKDLPAKDGDQVLQGLVQFAHLSGEHPKYRRLGVLSLGEPPWESHLRWDISTPRVKTLVNLAIFIPMVIGLFLFLASFRVLPAWRVTEFLKIVLLAVSAAIIYGVLHDQITARVCIDYFTEAHPFLLPTSSPTWLGLGWGIVATWWVGLALGIPAACVARIGRLPTLGAADLIRPVAALLFVMGLLALLAGCAGYALGYARLIELPPRLASPFTMGDPHYAGYLAVAAAHLASYGCGFIGGIVLLFWIRRQRRVRAGLGLQEEEKQSMYAHAGAVVQ